MMAFFCFVGCAQTYNGLGKFNQASVTLVVGEEVDPFELTETKSSLIFKSENENILAKNEDGKFVAKQSGETSLLALYEDNIVDVLSVLVRQQFEVPTNIKTNNNGLITWDESVVIKNGDVIYADYKISVERNGNVEEFSSTKNAYQLTEKGSYKIKVKAENVGDVLGSDYSQEILFDFALVDEPAESVFNPYQTFGSQTGTLTWNGTGQSYDIVFDGIEKELVKGNSYVLDFTNFSENDFAQVEIIANDGDLESKSNIVEVQKIATPEISLEGNELVWGDYENATDFIIAYSSLKGNGQIHCSQNSTILEGLEGGVYEISYQAIAKQNYANGNVKLFGKVAKIENVDVEYEFLDNTLQVTFSTNSPYNRRIAVSQNGIKKEYFLDDFSNGVYSLTQSFNLSDGENVFLLQTYPTFVYGKVVIDGISVSNAVKSDEIRLFSAYNVGEIANIHHSIEEKQSVLTFDNVLYANVFEVFVNDIKVENAQVEIGESATEIMLGQLSSDVYGDNDTYVIKIFATREEQENQIATTSQAEKTLTRLQSPEMVGLEGAKNEGQKYAWSAVAGAKYEYMLYSTPADYDLTQIEPVINETSDNFVNDLEAGYYVLQVKSLPLNDDLYLESETYSQDSFYVSLPIEQPKIKLEYSENENCYVLTILPSEYGYEYKISLNSNYLGSVINSLQTDVLTFKFDKAYDFANPSENYEITVEAVAENLEMQTVHTNSISKLTVFRLQATAEKNVTQNGEVLTVNNTDENAVLILTKDGSELSRGEGGQDVQISLNNYVGAFSVSSKLEGYQSFEGFTTDGKIYLESQITTFNFYRSSTPTNMFYNDDNIYFSHQTQSNLEKVYEITAEAISANGSCKVIFEVDLTDVDTSELSFNIDTQLQTILESNSEFASHFNQMTSLKVMLYSKICQEIDDVVYLPSRYATLKYNDTLNELQIQRLEKVKLNYNDDNRTITWSAIEGDNVSYYVYYNLSSNENKIEKIIPPVAGQSTYTFDLSSYDFTIPKNYEFYVVTVSENAFDSLPSGKVIVQKINPVESLNVFVRDGKYIASFELKNMDLDKVDYISLNGFEYEITATEFELTKNGDSPTVNENNETIIKIFGKAYEENGDATYYISSETSTFVLREIAVGEFDAQIEIADENITWEDFSSLNVNDWSSTTPYSNNVRYELRLIGEGQTLIASISNIASNNLSLANETLLNIADGTQATIQIYAYISEYTISQGGRGYFGKILIGEGTLIEKLNTVTELKAEIDESETTIAGEQSKNVVLSWEDNLNENAKYNVYANNKFVGTATEKIFNLAQSNLIVGKNTIKIVAVSSTQIEASGTEIDVWMFSKPTLSVTDDGILKIEESSTRPAPSEGYIIEFSVEENITTIYSASQEVDLQPYINGASGIYSIKVIDKATNYVDVAVPCSEIAEISGTILSAPTFVQDEQGLLFYSANGAVVYYVVCEEKGLSERLGNNRFTFPDDWDSGEYDILVYAVKNGYITSWRGESAKIHISFERIANISEITFQRTEDYNDYKIYWDPIDRALGYSIEVKAEGSTILTSQLIREETIMLSDLLGDKSLPAGNLTFIFRTKASYKTDSLTNSLPYEFTVSKIKNTIDSISVVDSLPDYGYLKYYNGFTGVATQIEVEDITGNTLSYVVKETSQAGISTFRIDDLSGSLTVRIRKLAVEKQGDDTQSSLDGIIKLDSDQKVKQVYKTQNIYFVSKNMSKGILTASFPRDEIYSKKYIPKFFAEYNGQKQELTPTRIIYNSTEFSFYAPDIAELFDIEDGTFVFKLSMAFEGCLVSDDYEVTFDFSNADGSVVAVKGVDERDDYLLVKPQGRDVRSIIVRSTDGEYYIVDLNNIKGYWVKPNGETAGYFSLTEVAGATNEECYAVNVASLLEGFDAGQKHLQVAYIYDNGTTGFSVVGYSEIFTYTKLSAPDSISVDLGNLAWTVTGETGTAYLISFENETSTNEIKVYDLLQNYYLGEDIDFQGTFAIAIQNVSSQAQVLASKKVYVGGEEPSQITKMGSISGLSLNDGSLTMLFTGVGELANDINNISNASQESLKASVNALLNKVYKEPFYFSLKDLPDLQFNLKFVNQDGQEFITTVSATNLLTGLNTPLEGFSEGDRMYNKSIIQGIESILAELPNGTTEKTQLNEIYLTLIDESKWTGVANEELLFDEIGEGLTGDKYNKISAEKIQAGVYDVYIQQEGSADFLTISSNYSMAISGAKVENSPMTLTGVSSDDVYYIEFEVKQSINDYTLVIRHDESGERTTEIVKITNTDGSWARTVVGGNDFSKGLETRTLGERIFVKLTLNDQAGIGQELNGGDGATSTHYTFNVYANGNEISFNSKTEEIDVYFFAFNYESLRLNSGIFYWNTFKITLENNTVAYFDSQVKFKQENYSEQKQTIKATSGQTSQSYSPTNVGNYDYIELSTPGWKEDYAIYVSSPIYRIENLTKLSAPELTTENGKILLTDVNSTTRENRTFVLRNNASLGYSLLLSTDENSYLHTPGLNGLVFSSALSNEYYYRLSEDNATMFDASLAGDSVNQGEFVLINSEKYNNFVLDVPTIEDRIYLQSTAGSISAKMIDYKNSTTFEGVSLTEGVQIIDGKVVWKEVESEVEENCKILYEVKVETYYQTSGGWTKDDYCTKQYYTSLNYLEQSMFVDSVASTQRYVIYVKANVFKLSETGEIVSLQGERFEESSQVVFADGSNRQVLNGELISNYTVNAEKFFEKSDSVSQFTVQNGELSWIYDYAGDLATKFLVEYSIAGINDWKTLLHEEGEIDCDNKTYYFTPQAGQLSSESAYNFRISVVNYKINSKGEMVAGGKLRSNLTMLGGESYTQINVLKDMSNDYFSTDRENNNYKIDFEKYYSLYPSISKNINLEIVIENEEGQTKMLLEGKNSSKEIDITEFVDSTGGLTFTVKPISISQTYLSAQSIKTFTLSETHWFEADKVEFDELSQTFSWTYGAVNQYKAIAENGENTIKVYYNNGTEFLPYGVTAGETVQVLADENLQGKLPVYYNDEKYYVESSKAKYSYDEEANVGYVTIVESTELLALDGVELVGTGITLNANEKYEFTQKYFVVKKQLLDDQNPTTYYLPLDAVATDGERFAVKTHGVVYLDDSLTTFKGIEVGSILDISSDDTPDNGYYTIEYFGVTVYIHVSNVEKLIIKDETADPENILFRVEITSQHEVVSQGVTTRTTTTRVYEDITIEDENEAGIYTTTFEPNLIGEILSFSVQARRGKNNLLSEKLEYKGSSISFNFFSAGEGSQSDPYLIESVDEFKNISYRAEKKYYHNEYYQTQTTITYYPNGTSSSPKVTEGQIQDNEKYYSFKQNADLEFENVQGFVVNQAFVGNYDGSDKTISVGFSSAELIDSFSSELQSTTVTFEKGAGLFKEIASEGNVFNVQLSVDFAYTSEFKNSCMLSDKLSSSIAAGLAVKNSGVISGVKLIAMQASFETNISGDGARLAYAGIVGKNEGKISDCVSQANVQIRQTATPSGTQNFVLSPIAIFNDGTLATISNCSNIGNLVVAWRISSSNDNSSILVAGVVISNRYGTLELCYNTGSVSAKTFVGASSSTSTVSSQTYGAGVVLQAQGGSLKYVSNAGTVSAGNAGGIAYSLSNVQIANIVALGKVDTGTSTMFNNLVAKTAIGLSGQTIFTHVVSPSGLVNVELISADKVITCGNTGWKIYVDYSSRDVHSVQYVKN